MKNETTNWRELVAGALALFPELPPGIAIIHALGAEALLACAVDAANRGMDAKTYYIWIMENYYNPDNAPILH